MKWKIGIICAGDSEVEPFLTHIQNCTVSEKASEVSKDITLGLLKEIKEYSR